jgi:drug/metabolite transporter (DMT)-like permease
MRDGRAVLALAGAAFCWSGNFVAGRALRADIDPALLNLLRWSLCLALLLPWVGARAWRSRHVLRRHWRLLLALGATGIAAFHTLVYIALQHSGTIDALLLLSLAPVAVLGGAALTGAARPSMAQWTGSAVSLLGAAVLLTHGEPARWAQVAEAPGALCMLLAVVLWAAYSLCLRRRPHELDHDVLFAASIVPAVVLLLAWVLLRPAPMAFALTARIAWSLAYIVVFASLAGFLLWSYGVAAIGPERAGPFINLMPLFGAAQAILLLDETLQPAHLGGAACVLAGVGLIGAKRRAAAAPAIGVSRR